MTRSEHKVRADLCSAAKVTALE
ncbi:hypothetical protein E2C01_090579 [Portunus trituberculatus]|uniref:Uncharacterized protein n=1 Tax=Portunus trituberculatus TaxID=210409 RepID=A0A5B7JGY3_PORTR|nr:hypothetical protein [Portunus trituberculatus]